MKLREIVKLSSIMLNIEDVLNSTKLYDESFDVLDEDTTLTSETNIDKTFNLLIRCFNLVYSEIATDYLPLINKQEIEVKNGQFELKNLNKNFYKLVKLEDKNFNSVNCEIYNDILYSLDGEYSLVYCYKPSFVTLNSEIDDFNGKITDRVLAYGLNKEYCYILGLYEDAESYKTKFEESLKSLNVIKKNIVLKNKRRWI